MHYRFQLGYRGPSFIYIFSPFFAWHPESSQLPHCVVLWRGPKGKELVLLCTIAISDPELASDHSVNKLEDRSSLGRVFRWPHSLQRGSELEEPRYTVPGFLTHRNYEIYNKHVLLEAMLLRGNSSSRNKYLIQRKFLSIMSVCH